MEISYTKKTVNREVLMTGLVLSIAVLVTGIIAFPLGNVHAGACNFVEAIGENLKVKGTDGCDIINAGACMDCKIIAGDGNDDITTGQGADKVNAGDGDDYIVNNDNDGDVDIINCGSGNDTVEVGDGSNPDGDIYRSCETVVQD